VELTPIIATYTRSTVVWNIALCIVVHTGVGEELSTPGFRVEYMEMEATRTFKLLITVMNSYFSSISY
jgi:hypothetical protein